MLSSRKSSQLLLWLSLPLWAAVFHASSSFAQQDDTDDDFEKAAVPGARAFNSTCAGCHGLDGRGTDKGANIAGSDKVKHLSDPQVSAIISNGVAGTGMPATPFEMIADTCGSERCFTLSLPAMFAPLSVPRPSNP